MNFVIGRKLTMRVITLSGRLCVSPKKLATKIFEKGITALKELTDRTLLLSDEDKKTIEKHPRTSHASLARQLRKSPRLIKNHRLALLVRHLKGHFGEDNDVVLARRFGLRDSDVRGKRYKLHLCYERGRNNRGISLKQFGNKKDILYELTEGGRYITDIIRARGFMFTRSRGQQIVAHHNFGDIRSKRTVLWYAHRLVGLNNKRLARKVANKEWMRKKLIASGGASALAAKLGLEDETFKSYLRDRLRVHTSLISSCPPAPMMEFNCTTCGDRFFVPRSKLVRERKKKRHHHKKRFCNKACKWEYMRTHWSEWFNRDHPKHTHRSLIEGNGKNGARN